MSRIATVEASEVFSCILVPLRNVFGFVLLLLAVEFRFLKTGEIR